MLDATTGIRRSDEADASIYLASLLDHVGLALQRSRPGPTENDHVIEHVATPVLVESAEKCPVDVFPEGLGGVCEQIAAVVTEKPALESLLRPLLWVLCRRGTIADWRSLSNVLGELARANHTNVLDQDSDTLWRTVLGEVTSRHTSVPITDIDGKVWVLELSNSTVDSAVELREWISRIVALVQGGQDDFAQQLLEQLVHSCPFSLLVQAQRSLWVLVQTICAAGSVQHRRCQQRDQGRQHQQPLTGVANPKLDVLNQRDDPKRHKQRAWLEILRERQEAALAGEHWLLAAALARLELEYISKEHIQDIFERAITSRMDASMSKASLQAALVTADECSRFSARLTFASEAITHFVQPNEIECVPIWILPWLLEPQNADDRHLMLKFIEHLWQYPVLRPYLARWLCLTEAGAGFVETERLIEHLEWSAELLASVPVTVLQSSASVLFQRLVAVPEPSWPQLRCLALLLDRYAQTELQAPLMNEANATAFVRCVAWTWQGPATALPSEEPLVAQVLATLIRHSCSVENSPVVAALLQVLDQSMRTSLGQERFLAALGIIARHGCSRLITVIIAALVEQATLLEQRRKVPGHEKSVVPALDRIALELERIATPHSVRKLLLEHGPRLFPLLLDTMLRNQETIDLIQYWLELPDATAVFACVYRLSFVFLIKHLQEPRLRALQQRTAALSIGPEEQALAVAESLTMSNITHRQRAWALLESITGTQVKVIARTQCTRIMLYLLSELGSRGQPVITTALEQIAFLVEADHVGQLVSHDLLRLLDTLNRRIFKRQDPEAVRILPFLFTIVQQELHLFVPKILATLKNALELAGQRMQEAVFQAWIAFLECLGWERAAPHLGTVVAILGPFLEHERELAETLFQLISACAASSSNEFLDEIFLPAPVQSLDEFVSRATIQVGLEQHDVAPEQSAALAVSVARENVSSDPTVLAPSGHANDTPALQTSGSTSNGTSALSAIRTLLDRRRHARTLNEQLERLLPVATTHHSRMVRLLALREVSQLVQHHRSQLYIDLLLHQNTRLVSELLHRGLLVAATDADMDCRQEALSALALLGAIDPARLYLGHHKIPSPTTQSSASNVIETESFIDDTVIPTLLEQCLIPALRRVESSQAREWQNRIGFAIQEVLRLAMDTTSSREQAASVSLNETSKQHSTDECARYVFWHALSEQARQIIRPFLHSRYILRSVVLKGTSEETQKDQEQAAHSAPVGPFERTLRVTLDRAQLLPSKKRLEQATAALPAGDTNGSCPSNERLRPQDLEPSQVPQLSALPEDVTGCTRCAIVPGITAAQWICTFAVHLADVLDQIMNETSTLTETSRSAADSEPQQALFDRTHRRWWGLFRACRSLMGHDRNTAVYLLPHLVQVLLQLSSDLDIHGVGCVSQVLNLDSAHRPKPLQQVQVAAVSQRQTLPQSSRGDLPTAHRDASGPTQAEAVAASPLVPAFASRNEQAVMVTGFAQPGWITAMTAFLRAHLVCVLSSDLNEAIQLVFLLLDRLAERRDRHYMISVRAVEPPKLSVGEYAALATAAAQQPAQVCPFNALEAGLPAGLLARAAVTSGALHRALLYLEQSERALKDDERRLAQRLYRELGEFDAMQAVAVQRLPSILDLNREHSSWPASSIPSSQAASLQPSLSDLECFTLDAEAHHAPDEALIGYEQRLRQCPRDSETQRGYLQCLQALGLWETMLNYVLAHPDMQSVADLGIEAALRLAHWDALETLSQPMDVQERGHTAYMVSVARALEQARANRDELLPETLRLARVALSETVAAAALESYTRAYPAMVRLHAIAEIESVLGVDDIEAVRHYVRELVVAPHGVTNWMQCRLDCVALTWQAREPILAIQRAALLVQSERCSRTLTKASSLVQNASAALLPQSRSSRTTHAAQHGSAMGRCLELLLATETPADRGYFVDVDSRPQTASIGRRLAQVPPQRVVTAALCAEQGRETTKGCLSNNRGPLEAALVYREAAHAVTLQLARLARKSGHHAAAMAYLQQIGGDSVFQWPASIELAKIYRARGETRRALAHLPVQSPQRTAPTLAWLDQDQTLGTAAIGARLQSKALCLQARWMQEDRSAPPQEIIACFQRAIAVQPHTEKVYVLLGRFYDSLTPEQDALPAVQARQQWTYRQLALEHYARSLRYGCRYVYHSLPRLITLWLDEQVEPVADSLPACQRERTSSARSRAVATETALVQTELTDSCYRSFATPSTHVSEEQQQQQQQQRRTVIPDGSAAEYFLPIMRKLRARLPLYIWFVVMPQLLSRVTAHTSAVVRSELCSLLADCVVAYPGQAIWCILPLASALDATRATTGQEIIEEARRRGDAALGALLDSGLELCAQLVRVCMQTPPRGLRQMTASMHLRGLRRLLRERLQSFAIPVPYQEYLRLLLPTDGRFRDDLHEGFAIASPTLVDVDETVLVMNSLMRPKRIGLVASDGRVYPFLCKREDAGDMRKDARMMDLLSVVNRLLAKTAAAQQRRLVLRTYAVLPLNEECGILEWVPHLMPLRAAVGVLHRALGNVTTTEEIRLAYERNAKASSEAERVRWFTEWLLPRFPPVLRHFYVAHFGRRRSPAAWFAARQAFARSCALWSMVGYIVGLGDRHGENVLLDTQSGECVHVDFACLFDKGLTLKVPETVPFRLTPNMVDAMGTAGYEGVFYRTAQITLSVLRSHRETLLSVLETFLHDPLLDWTTPTTTTRSEATPRTALRSMDRGVPPPLRGLATAKARPMVAPGKPPQVQKTRNPAPSVLERNAQALEMLRVVDRKCRGLHGAQSGTPLSVEGDVARLVAEATNVRNLALMYIWWLPHI